MKNNQPHWLNHPFFLSIGLLASVIGILVFVTGRQSIYDFMPSSSTSQATSTSQPVGPTSSVGDGLIVSPTSQSLGLIPTSTTNNNDVALAMSEPTAMMTDRILVSKDPIVYLPRFGEGQIPVGMRIIDPTYITNEMVAQDAEMLRRPLVDFGRINGYRIEYLPSRGCSSNSGVKHIVNIIAVYDTVLGAQQSYEYSHNQLLEEQVSNNQDMADLSVVGDDAYVRWWNSDYNPCEGSNSSRGVRIEFRRKNATVAVVVSSVNGTLTDEKMLLQVVTLAKAIDEKLLVE